VTTTANYVHPDSWGCPQAPSNLWGSIARMWNWGFNTLEIAKALGIREAAVFNSLHKALGR
jgi:hypothetical protein